MTFASLVLLTGVCASDALPALENAMPLRVAGPWVVEVGPGTVEVDDTRMEIEQAVTLHVEPPPLVTVQNERHAALPVFNPKTGGWRKGARLEELIAQECTATGLLLPETLRIRSCEDPTVVYEVGKDYQLDPFWATFGIVEGSAIKPDQPVLVDYAYHPCRLDNIVLNANGGVRLVEGETGHGSQLPPKTAEGETVIGRIWLSGNTETLTDENLYPIALSEPAGPPATPRVAKKLLPETLAKLRKGQPVTIVAWGDSVTNGGGVGAEHDLWYQHQFGALLRERFPESEITVLTAAWPGAGSRQYLEAPAGGKYDFVRDVLDPKPDLVTIEFVNDAYLDEQGTLAHYTPVLDRIRANGSEVILITPHLVRPDWLKTDTEKVDVDPRAYVRGLKQLAEEQDVALADASAEWCRLWRKGIPYTTLLGNAINHPDERGHRIFAYALIALFPK